jgi:hypothetical protein
MMALLELVLEIGSAMAGAFLVVAGKPAAAAAAFAWAAFCVAWDARGEVLRLRRELLRRQPPDST